MKEVIGKLERILELTKTHGIYASADGEVATEDCQLRYVESKIRLNAIQALSMLDKMNTESEKPKRVKVEYVKHNVNEEGGKFWEVARDWSEGEPCVFHYLDANSYWSIADNDRLLKEYTNRNLYRRIETEIDERQEFIDEACGTLDDDESVNHYSRYFGQLYDSGKFKLVNDK